MESSNATETQMERAELHGSQNETETHGSAKGGEWGVGDDDRNSSDVERREKNQNTLYTEKMAKERTNF